MGRRGYAVESVAGRICREARGRVTQNIMVRNLDLEHLQGPAGRRYTTLVSAFRSDGSARRRAADFDGVALEAVR